MDYREFTFDIKEVRKHSGSKEIYLQRITGFARLIDGDMEIFIDDHNQPSGTFKSKDNFFNRLIKGIFDKTGG